MTSPESHLERIQQHISQYVQRKTETVPIEKSLGKVAAANISAEFDSPRFTNSQMDGYAVPHSNGGSFIVAVSIPAGTEPDLLGGKAAPIMTGAAVPADAAAIVPVEQCSPSSFLDPGETIDIPEVKPHQFIREQGSDVQAGKVILPEGMQISGAAVATLASQSIFEVEVISPLRLLICTGGAEISTEAGAASIPDSNAPMLRAIAHASGIEVVGHVSTDDDPKTLSCHLSQAIRKYNPDAVVTSGGISAGKYEVIRQVLEAADSNAWFGHVDQQPGGPQGFAAFDGVPFICLPGNPVSTLVSFRLFVAPVLGYAPQASWAVLVDAVSGITGRDQFRRGQIEYRNDGTAVAHISGGAGSHLITQAVQATHLIRIPADAELTAGSVVQIYPL